MPGQKEQEFKITFHNEGEGELCPEGSIVLVHYHGTLMDGSVFDSSVEREEPFEF